MEFAEASLSELVDQANHLRSPGPLVPHCWWHWASIQKTWSVNVVLEVYVGCNKEGFERQCVYLEADLQTEGSVLQGFFSKPKGSVLNHDNSKNHLHP